jgi:LCP family protein required for cell wall assembly
MKTNKTGPKKVLRVFLIGALVIIALFTGVAAYLFWDNGKPLRETPNNLPAAETLSDRSMQSESEQGDDFEADPNRIYYNGKYYTLNPNLFSVLLMGIDTWTRDQYANIGQNSNQADSLVLVLIDSAENKLSAINIPRNSITEVKQLDVNMNYARTTRSPICIQHAFGDGKELSCTLTRDAASNLLFNIPINRYLSINFDGMITANDAVGGVTLKLLDDFTAYRAEMKKGITYTLLGADAKTYVSGRTMPGLDGTNLTRVQRQIQYYKAFFEKAKDKLTENPFFALDMYAKTQDAVVTDIRAREIISLSKLLSNVSFLDSDIYMVPGAAMENEDYIVDDARLKELLIQTLYVEIAP